MKKKTVIRVVIALFALVILLVALILYAAKHSFRLNSYDSSQFVSTDNSNSVVYGADTEYDVSICASGFFYVDDSLICYYDPAIKESYVLCSKPNCLHATSSCNAYFPSNWTGQELDNVAQYGDYVYCTAYNSDTGTMDLFQVDPVNDTRKSLVAFPSIGGGNLSDYDGQHWACGDIRDVYYAGGYAWMEIQWVQLGGNLNKPQLCGVDLSSGEMVYLNEIDVEGEWEFYNWERICSDYVIYKQIRYTDEEVDESEYYAQFGDGPATIDGMTFESYYDYWCWYCNETPQEYVFKAYDIQNKRILTLDEGIASEVLGDYGTLIPHFFSGTYEGKAIYGEYVMGEDGGLLGTLYLMDVETKEKEFLCDIGHGTVNNVPVSRLVNLVRSDNTLFYCTNPYGVDASGRDSGLHDMMSLDLATGESTYLYTDIYNTSVRILKDTADGYYVHLYGETEEDWEDNFCYYWISREDYRSGKFDNLIQYKVDVSWR